MRRRRAEGDVEVRLWAELVSFVRQGGRGRWGFPGNRRRRRPPLRRPKGGGRRLVGYGGVEPWGSWWEGQRRRGVVHAGRGGGQPLQGAPQTLVHLIQVDVVQVSGGQVETTGEALHGGLRGRRTWR